MANDENDDNDSKEDHNSRITNNYFYANVQGSTFGANSTVNNDGDFNSAWKEVFDWLTQGKLDLNYLGLQADYERRCQPGLGQWFIDAKNFHEWRAGSYRTLFCHGRRKTSS